MKGSGMGKTPKRDVASEAMVLAITIGQYLDRHGVEYTVFIERPGRDGQFSRSWSNAAGQLQTDQLEDMAAYCQRTVVDAMLVWHGVQGVLET